MRRRLGREQDAAYFSHISKDVQENTSSDTNIVLEAVGQIWFLRKIDQKSKITQVEITWVEVENQISTPNYIYQNDQHKNIHIWRFWEGNTHA